MLPEHEYWILGVVWREGPLTAYRVCEWLASSGSGGSSKGTVYPAIRRLIRAGLVDPQETGDRRGARELRVTAEGRKTLTDWVSSVSNEARMTDPDSVRMKVQFIDSLPAAAREAFFEDARRSGRRHLQRLQFLERAVRDKPASLLRWLEVAARILELEARLTWLDVACAAVLESSPYSSLRAEDKVRPGGAVGTRRLRRSPECVPKLHPSGDIDTPRPGHIV